jgi:hypothetical protein
MIPILLALAFIAILFVVVITGQPDEFKVIRTTKITASPEEIFPHVNDLHKWEPWSPWAKLDPKAHSTFTGPDAGTSAAMAWVGNRQVGEGQMTITESQPSELICFRLDFLKPMKATNTAEFAFVKQGNQTCVTWAMGGKNNFVGKMFGLIFNCEKMVGGKFEQGLADLKAIAERR